MVLIQSVLEQDIKNALKKFLKQQFKASVKINKKVLKGLVPDYFLQKSNGQKRIVIFRNPPVFPETNRNEIKTAMQNGIGVYIAIYNYENNPLLEQLCEQCQECGVGVIQCSSTLLCRILVPSVRDYPREDNIIEGRTKFFISSKLWLPEREVVRKKLKFHKHQPICMERIPGHGSVQEECFRLIDESQFFIGIITPEYRSWVDKEIRYALKKKQKRCKVYVRADCFPTSKKKLNKLIIEVRKVKVSHGFGTADDLGKLIPKHAEQLISKQIPSKEI